VVERIVLAGCRFDVDALVRVGVGGGERAGEGGVFGCYPVQDYNGEENCGRLVGRWRRGRGVDVLSALQHIRQIQEASPWRTIRTVRLL